jgi:DNA mismatch repair protein MutL
MGKIKQLSLHEAHKIAAGEVVERPANAVKELLENALDAGADTISVYIQDGGQQLIRIVDNGSGMASDDAQLCFEQHATSKITSVDQLATLTSFGFRGEALTSIAAISKITLVTREHSASSGLELRRENGKIITFNETSCAPGTDISVHDLFYNVPARKKFLKTAQTEWRHIVQLFQAFCFAYPFVYFKLYSDNALVHNCPPVQTLRDRAHQLWEHNLAQGMIPLTGHTRDEVAITGIISNHQQYRYDRSHIFLYVNNRWIKNPSLVKAIMKGYLNVLPPDRFPAAIINITLPTTLVDINIHPRKEEVQFVHPRIIENLMQGSITKTLEEYHAQRLISSAKSPLSLENAHNQKMNVSTSLHNFPPVFSQKSLYSPLPSAVAHLSSAHSLQITQPSLQQMVTSQNMHDELMVNIIGNAYDTYIIMQTDTELLFIDQHAAHERILYERFKKQFGSLPSIQLVFPQTVMLNAQDLEHLPVLISVLSLHAITIEQIGPEQVIIQSVPVHLKKSPIGEIIKETIALLAEHNHGDSETLSRTLHEKVHAMMACKAAVKAGDKLSQEHMEQLIRDLYQTDNRFTCPHGRPTLWSIPQIDLEKKFKRKL